MWLVCESRPIPQSRSAVSLSLATTDRLLCLIFCERVTFLFPEKPSPQPRAVPGTTFGLVGIEILISSQPKIKCQCLYSAGCVVFETVSVLIRKWEEGRERERGGRERGMKGSLL